MLVFADIETTGLSPEKDSLLEIALIITDDKLVELSRSNTVIYSDYSYTHEKLAVNLARAAVDETVDPYVVKMHYNNGLWKESSASGSVSLWMAEASIVQQVADLMGPDDGAPIIAGNSIHFDRGFIAVHMPIFDKLLHYRHFDCTTLNEFAKRFAPAVYAARPGANDPAPHRAMPDAENSLALARYYCSAFGAPAVEVTK